MDKSTTNLVSIVLPTYNGSTYLAKAVESCLRQDYRELELIVVDDASTENVFSIIEPYRARDIRVRYIRHETNQKLPAALNTGFRASSGGFLTWISDDNEFSHDAIGVMVAFLNETPDIGLVFADTTKIDEFGNTLDFQNIRPAKSFGFLGNCVGPCFLYRRKVYEVTGEYDTSHFLMEDYDYWIRIRERFAFGYLPKKLYSVRYHPRSLTAQRRALIDQAYVSVMEHRLEADPGMPAALGAGLHFALSDFYEHQGKKKESGTHLFQALGRDLPAVLSTVPFSRLLKLMVFALLGYRAVSLLHSLRSIVGRGDDSHG